MFALLTGAWLTLRAPRYWTGGLSGISKLKSLRTTAATNQPASPQTMNSA
jgi:hypothetical protein